MIQLIQRLNMMQDVISKGELLHNKLHGTIDFVQGKQDYQRRSMKLSIANKKDQTMV